MLRKLSNKQTEYLFLILAVLHLISLGIFVFNSDYIVGLMIFGGIVINASGFALVFALREIKEVEVKNKNDSE